MYLKVVYFILSILLLMSAFLVNSIKFRYSFACYNNYNQYKPF